MILPGQFSHLTQSKFRLIQGASVLGVYMGIDFRQIAAWLFICIATTGPALAQPSQGAISGTVTDSTGAVVSGARIVAHNEATGATGETVSSSAGAYSFPNLNA